MHICGIEPYSTYNHVTTDYGTLDSVEISDNKNDIVIRGTIDDDILEIYKDQTKPIALYCLDPGDDETNIITLATSKIDAIFKGESVHASKWPEKGKNAILAAAEFAILSNNIASELNANINVGVIKGGSGRNVVADYAVCQCETRGETEEKNETAKKGLIISAKECSKKYGCDVELKYAGYGTNFSSDEFISGLGNKVASSMENIEYRYKKFTASEDFTNIAKFTEGFGTKCGYFTFGTELKAEHHTPNFDFDEEVLLKGTEFMFGLCRELLLEKGESYGRTLLV